MLCVAAFRFLTAREIATRQLLPGALLAALLWVGLQLLGGYYVDHVVRNASETYGLFGVVIGLLAFLALAGQLTIVRLRQMWW